MQDPHSLENSIQKLVKELFKNFEDPISLECFVIPFYKNN